MSTADLREVGSISLLDLDIISGFYGRDFLPYPFMFTQPSKFAWHEEYTEYARSVPDRFSNGDLRVFRECAGSFVSADIRVECHVQYIPDDTPSVRVLGYRLDQAGYLAKQRPNEDVLDVYELSPYLLGPAVADAVPLKKPGRRPAIVIPEYLRVAETASTSDEVSIHHSIEGEPSATTVADAEVTAFGTVQSHWRPTRRWGIDHGKNFAAWVRVKDDGEYLFQPDFSAAKPVTASVLADRIDRLISEDVKALRQFRNG